MNFNRFGYKAKKTNSKKWLYAGFDDSEELLRWLLRDEDNNRYDPAWIDRKTICQCTGLRDSEGKLIYENDYIKITGKEGNIEKALVQYEENILEYVLIFNGSELPIRFFLMWMEEGKKCYVVGNKFDKES